MAVIIANNDKKCFRFVTHLNLSKFVSIEV